MKNITIALLLFTFVFTSCKKDKDPDGTTNTNNTPAAGAIEVTAADGLKVTVENHPKDASMPVIVLCHQAGFSRGEYSEITPRLLEMGFNCVTVDLRSGGSVNGVDNATFTRAKAAGKATGFNDSKQDMVAAITWAKENYGKNVILWGSSYSASLALILGKQNANVEQVICFSPGEYLSPVNVGLQAKGMSKPCFLASAYSERGDVGLLYNVITSSKKTQFIPKKDGQHGSKSLWKSNTNSSDYWAALSTFLGK